MISAKDKQELIFLGLWSYLMVCALAKCADLVAVFCRFVANRSWGCADIHIYGGKNVDTVTARAKFLE
jgi:hypothetical protein